MKKSYLEPSILVAISNIDILSASTEGDNGDFSLEWLALDGEESVI
ncbi:MAG: hypothetical protein IJD54_01980 [Clostridia bacterium]|nr:hypothetical protein [Clostridia bacterium]